MRRELAPGERLGRKPMWRFPPHTLFRTRESPPPARARARRSRAAAPRAAAGDRRGRRQGWRGYPPAAPPPSMRRRARRTAGRPARRRLRRGRAPLPRRDRAASPVADVPGLRPVRAHETRVHLLVQPALTRELRELERLARVGNDLRRRVVLEAGVHDHLPRPLVDVLRIAAVEFLARDPLGRVLRVQVEGQPLHLRPVLPLQPCGPLQGHRAERSDVVAPDPDGELAHPFTLPIYHRLRDRSRPAGRDDEV